MVEAGFLYVGSQGILWSADHNKSVVKRAWLTDVALISRFICSRWVPDLEGYSAPGPPLGESLRGLWSADHGWQLNLEQLGHMSMRRIWYVDGCATRACVIEQGAAV
jgi:hypothetical protein